MAQEYRNRYQPYLPMGTLSPADQQLWLHEELQKIASAINASQDYTVFPNRQLEGGIKVDQANPDWPWHDLIGEITVRGTGATDPAWATYAGNIKQYQFTVGDECWVNFHVPHDYAPGTDIHLHFHWSHNSTLVTGGTATWGYYAQYAKGHDQAAFGTEVGTTVAGNASTTQYQHIITEIQLSAASPTASQLDSDDLEVDGLIQVNAYLSANGITSSGAVPDPFLHYVDIHYQSTDIGTKNKAPDFWTG